MHRTATIAWAWMFGLASFLAADPASAQCGGICLYEVGSQEMGESYAGAPAVADSASTAYLSPAGLTRLERAEIHTGIYGAFFNLTFDSTKDKTSRPGGEFSGDGGNTGEFLTGPGL